VSRIARLTSFPLRTLGEEAILPGLGVLAQKPAISKVIVTLDQLNAVPASQTKLVGTAGQELVCSSVSAVGSPHGNRSSHLRTTTRVSPGRQCSVCCAMVANGPGGWQEETSDSQMAAITQTASSRRSSHHRYVASRGAIGRCERRGATPAIEGLRAPKDAPDRSSWGVAALTGSSDAKKRAAVVADDR
jgi:hypothetical protein